LDKTAAKRRLDTETKRLHELQVICAELKSLREGSHVYTRIANGNVFLMTTHDRALMDTEKELKALSHTNVHPPDLETMKLQ